MSRRTLILALAPITALVVACGSDDDYANELRPPDPVPVSVNVAADEVSVSPGTVGFHPLDERNLAAIAEGEEVVELSDRPLPVHLTIANTLNRPVRLAISGPEQRISERVTATGTLGTGIELPNGSYRVKALGAPEARQGRLRVGRMAISPQNVLLLP